MQTVSARKKVKNKRLIFFFIGNLLLYFYLNSFFLLSFPLPPFLFHTHKTWDNGCQKWHGHHKRNTQDIYNDIWSDCLPDISHSYLRRSYPFHHKKGNAKGRGDQTCFQSNEHQY